MPIGWWIAIAIQAAVFIAMLLVRRRIWIGRRFMTERNPHYELHCTGCHTCLLRRDVRARHSGRAYAQNTADYYVAGRQVNGFFAGIVYTTSLVSAGALVGWVSQTWQWGLYFIYAASAVTVATFLCWWLLGRKLWTCSRDLNLFTVPDFLEGRAESRTARLIASLLVPLPFPSRCW